VQVSFNCLKEWRGSLQEQNSRFHQRWCSVALTPPPPKEWEEKGWYLTPYFQSERSRKGLFLTISCSLLKNNCSGLLPQLDFSSMFLLWHNYLIPLQGTFPTLTIPVHLLPPSHEPAWILVTFASTLKMMAASCSEILVFTDNINVSQRSRSQSVQFMSHHTS
jgi:hypothetical protein